MGKKRQKSPAKLVIIGRDTQDDAPEMPSQPDIIKPVINFDAWWIMKAQSLKLKPEMKDAVKKHFMARGFMDSGDFDNGIIDFGI